MCATGVRLKKENTKRGNRARQERGKDWASRCARAHKICAAAHKRYAETDIEMKAKALATCEIGPDAKRRVKQWKDDPDLMEFLRSL